MYKINKKKKNTFLLFITIVITEKPARNVTEGLSFIDVFNWLINSEDPDRRMQPCCEALHVYNRLESLSWGGKQTHGIDLEKTTP